MRIGFGYDVHRLVQGRRLVLGGVDIAHPLGLLGHSDADVLLHAIIDALFGAASLGDIGAHFPSTEKAYKDISSVELLKRAVEIIKKKGFSIGNIDSTIVCEGPRLADFIPDMVKNISKTLGCDKGRVSVKAKTEEGLGFTGSGQGISAYAVALVEEMKEK